MEFLGRRARLAETTAPAYSTRGGRVPARGSLQGSVEDRFLQCIPNRGLLFIQPQIKTAGVPARDLVEVEAVEIGAALCRSLYQVRVARSI